MGALTPIGNTVGEFWAAALRGESGAASITRFTHKVMRMRTTAVEINPTVIGACRMWFQLPADDARLQVVEADAGAHAVTDDMHRSADDGVDEVAIVSCASTP